MAANSIYRVTNVNKLDGIGVASASAFNGADLLRGTRKKGGKKNLYAPFSTLLESNLLTSLG